MIDYDINEYLSALGDILADFINIFEGYNDLISYLLQRIQEVDEIVTRLSKLVDDKDETIASLFNRYFGRKTQKLSELVLEKNMDPLFDVSDIDKTYPESQPDSEVEIITVPEHTVIRKKYKGQLEEKLAGLPHEEQIIDGSLEDQTCDYCGSQMVPMGKKFVGSRLVTNNPEARVVDIYVRTYICPECKKDGESIIQNATPPVPVIPKSYVSPSYAAYVIHHHFFLVVPYNKLVANIRLMGFKTSSKSLSNQVNYIAFNWFYPIYERMRQILLSEKYIQADETWCYVHNEEGRKNTSKSWMWVFSSRQGSPFPIRLFKYDPSRAGEVPKCFLAGFSGFLITDGFNAYNKVEDIVRSYCWAHFRSEVFKAIPADRKIPINSATAILLLQIKAIFNEESRLNGLDADTKLQQRLQKVKPLVDDMIVWIEEKLQNPIGSKKLENALKYFMDRKEGF